MSIFLEFSPCLLRYMNGRFFIVEGEGRNEIVVNTSKKGYRAQNNAQASMQLINERRLQKAFKEFYTGVASEALKEASAD